MGCSSAYVRTIFVSDLMPVAAFLQQFHPALVPCAIPKALEKLVANDDDDNDLDVNHFLDEYDFGGTIGVTREAGAILMYRVVKYYNGPSLNFRELHLNRRRSKTTFESLGDNQWLGMTVSVF